MAGERECGDRGWFVTCLRSAAERDDEDAHAGMSAPQVRPSPSILVAVRRCADRAGQRGMARGSEGTSPRARVHVDLGEMVGCGLALEAFTI